MGKVIINSTTLENIANAIRAKTNSNEKLLPSEMPSAISSIDGGTTTGDVYISSYQPLKYEIVNPDPDHQRINISSSSTIDTTNQLAYTKLSYSLSGNAGYVVGTASKSYDIEDNSVIFSITAPRLVAEVNEDGYTVIYGRYTGSYTMFFTDYKATQETGNVFDGKICLLRTEKGQKDASTLFDITLPSGGSPSSVTEIYVPELTTIKNGFAIRFNSLTPCTISMPNLVSISYYGAFQYCSGIQSLIMPNLETLGESRIFSESSLQEVTLEKCTSIPESTFYYCRSLKKVTLPQAVSIGESSFSSCGSLELIDLYSATSIGNDAFFGCSLNKGLIIRTPGQVCTLENSDEFYYAASSFKIYVPDDLVEDYKVATNWVNYANKITPLSEYVEE